MEGGSSIAGQAAAAAPPRTTWLPTDLLGVLALLRRHWRLMVACVAAGVVALLAQAVLISGPQYMIGAKILVNLGPEMVASPLLTAREGAGQAPPLRRPEDPATGVEIFNNPRLVREVVAQLGEEFFSDAPPQSFFQHVKHFGKEVIRAAQESLREVMVMAGLRPRTTRLDRIALAISAALRVEPVRRTDIIDLTFAFPDPRAGEIVLGRFIELAMSGHIYAYRMPGVTAFFRAGRAERQAELRAAEERLLAYRLDGATPVWSVAEQRPVLVRAEADAQLALRQAQAGIAATEAEIRRAEQALAALPAEIELSTLRSRNTTTDALRARLAQLRVDLATQQGRYGEGSPEIAEIRRQTEALVGLLDAEDTYRVDQVTLGINALHQALERDVTTKRIDLEGQRGRARQLEAQVADLRAQLRAVETAAIEIALREQEVARLRRALDLYDRGFEDARIAEAMEAVQLSGLRVVMPPTAEILPSSPSLRRTLIMGVAAGLVLAFALVLLLEYRATLRDGAPEDGPPLPQSPATGRER
jgi:uncharacterized protein involved in exopolysaccharide biosynthesis